MWLELTQEQRPTPALVGFAQLLALPSQELYQRIEQELAANPALEAEELESCELCGSTLERGICFPCLAAPWGSVPSAGEEQGNDLEAVPHQVQLSEYLLREVSLTLPREDLALAEEIIGSLDERGFLEEDPGQLSARLGVLPERLRCVLQAVQAAGPVGLACRGSRECLLAQIEHLESQGQPLPAAARAIVEAHLEELGRGWYGRIAASLGIPAEEVRAARDFIRRHLRPYPAFRSQLEEGWVGEPSQPILPDILLREDPLRPGELLVEVVASRQVRLGISPAYRRAAQRLRSSADALLPEEVEHVRGHLRRAKAFLLHLRRRSSALQRVAEAAARRQRRFLLSGQEADLASLAQAELAQELGMHPSTVSRAVAGKYLLLPDRRLLALERLFPAAPDVKAALRELLSQEAERPRSDADLARELQRRGFRVARRTVTKYRRLLGVLPSTQR